MLIPIVARKRKLVVDGSSSSSNKSCASDADENGIPKWVLLELNGQLLSPTPSSTTSVVAEDGTELGMISFDNGTPVIVVGTHEIRGKIEKLPKPFLVLRKGTANKTDSGETGEAVVVIEGIIEEKFLFNSYPKTIMRSIAGI